MTKAEAPKPQKVGFGLRGASILTNSTNLLKVTKKSPKGHQNGPKRSQRDDKDSPGPSQRETKTNTRKRDPKPLNNKLSKE